MEFCSHQLDVETCAAFTDGIYLGLFLTGIYGCYEEVVFLNRNAKLEVEDAPVLSISMTYLLTFDSVCVHYRAKFP
jgi:hypothetical protein